MNIFGIGLAVLITYFSIFSIVDRICTCKENCARYDSYGQILTNNNEEKEKDEEETC